MERLVKFFIDYNVVCPRRRLDSFKVKKYLEKNNFLMTENPKKADFIFLVGCAVRKIEEDIAFRLIKKYKKLKGELIVLGCLSMISHNRLTTEFKGKYFSPKNLNELDKLFPDFQYKYSEISDPVTYFPGDSLAKIKIAEGCSGNCSYCIIKKSMGELKSFPMETCLNKYARLIKKGYRSFEINSEDVGGYGVDIGKRLPDLLYEFLKIDKNLPVSWAIFNVAPQWLVKYEKEIIDLIKKKRIVELKCDIQSGSERILRLMNRYHDLGRVFEIFEKIKKENPGFKFFNQAIVGFPGETKEEFERTLEVVAKLEPHRMQFFSYGDSEKVPAYNLPDKISEKIKRKRLAKAQKYFLKKGYKVCYKLEGVIFLIKK